MDQDTIDIAIGILGTLVLLANITLIVRNLLQKYNTKWVDNPAQTVYNYDIDTARSGNGLQSS